MRRELLRELFPGEEVAEGPRGLPGRPDFFLPRLGLAAFMDGCFWHGCPRCRRRPPEQNREYWEEKVRRNRRRDRRADRALRAMGLAAVRVWEHELKGGAEAARRKLLRAARRAERRAEGEPERRAENLSSGRAAAEEGFRPPGAAAAGKGKASRIRADGGGRAADERAPSDRGELFLRRTARRGWPSLALWASPWAKL